MLHKLLITLIFFNITFSSHCQPSDTVIINLAKTSKIIFTVEDPDDLEILKHYDFQKLFDDVLIKLNDKKQAKDGSDTEQQDSTYVSEENTLRKEGESAEERAEREEAEEREEEMEREEMEERAERSDDENDYEGGSHNDNDDEHDDDDNYDMHWRGHRWNRTWQAFNFDLGMNNYLEGNDFPSSNAPYAVRPWGSWYVGLSSVQRSRLAKKFFLEWGIGMSWYTFKFEEDNVLLVKSDDGLAFEYDMRDLDFIKSKLSASYIQATLIPVVDFGDHGRKPRLWDGHQDHSFRIGLGPYIGYRISSHSKLVIDDDGKQKEKDNDSFYLNNLRYGARLQIGYRSTDLFFNYDLNELFEEDKAPKLNAFSFGVIF